MARGLLVTCGPALIRMPGAAVSGRSHLVDPNVDPDRATVIFAADLSGKPTPQSPGCPAPKPDDGDNPGDDPLGAQPFRLSERRGVVDVDPVEVAAIHCMRPILARERAHAVGKRRVTLGCQRVE